MTIRLQSVLLEKRHQHIQRLLEENRLFIRRVNHEESRPHIRWASLEEGLLHIPWIAGNRPSTTKVHEGEVASLALVPRGGKVLHPSMTIPLQLVPQGTDNNEPMNPRTTILSRLAPLVRSSGLCRINRPGALLPWQVLVQGVCRQVEMERRFTTKASSKAPPSPMVFCRRFKIPKSIYEIKPSF